MYGIRHVHTQDTPDTVWVVKHSLDEFPAVNVIRRDGDFYQLVIPMQLEYTDRNTIKVKFVAPTAGVVNVH